MILIENKNKDSNRISKLKIQRITTDKIELENVLKSFDIDEESGAIVSFSGSVRNFSANGSVKGIYYEAYLGMAEEKIKDIENTVKNKWKIRKLKIIHRIGELSIGDKSIVIVVSSSHSKDAFEACQFILNRIKHEVPIWKREILSDGKTKWLEGNSIYN